MVFVAGTRAGVWSDRAIRIARVSRRLLLPLPQKVYPEPFVSSMSRLCMPESLAPAAPLPGPGLAPEPNQNRGINDQSHMRPTLEGGLCGLLLNYKIFLGTTIMSSTYSSGSSSSPSSIEVMS